MLRIPLVFLGDALFSVDVSLLQVRPDVDYLRSAVVYLVAALSGFENRAHHCFRLVLLNTTVPFVPPKTPPVRKKTHRELLIFDLFVDFWTAKTRSTLPTLFLRTLLTLLGPVLTEKTLSPGPGFIVMEACTATTTGSGRMKRIIISMNHV